MVAINEIPTPGSETSRRRTQPLVDNLYQGMTLDAVTGLYDDRARDYSPSLGRWTEQDPAQYINGANTYQFVDSSPVGSVDASGLYLGFSRLTGAIGYGIYRSVTGVEAVGHAVGQGAADAYNATTSALGHAIYGSEQAAQRAVQELRALPAALFHQEAESLYHEYCHCKQKREGRYFGVGLGISAGGFDPEGLTGNGGLQAIIICAAKQVAFYYYAGAEGGGGTPGPTWNIGPQKIWGKGVYNGCSSSIFDVSRCITIC
ncbi:MAG: RHS repeat-associated core domain-containing protein [Phycisphaerae bacterium]